MFKNYKVFIGIIFIVAVAGVLVFLIPKKLIKPTGPQTKSSEFVPECTDELNAQGLQCALTSKQIEEKSDDTNELINIMDDQTGLSSESLDNPEDIVQPVDNGAIKSDWKIYRNEEYSYEFKYPEVLGVSKLIFKEWSTENVRLGMGQGAIEFKAGKIKDGENTQDYICEKNIFTDDRELFDKECQALFDKERISTGGPTGTYYLGTEEVSPNIPAYTMESKVKGETFKIYYLELPGRIALEIKVSKTFFAGYEKILNTFQLIDNTIYEDSVEQQVVSETDYWTTYKNKDYGIEFKHPSYLAIDRVASSGLELYFKSTIKSEVKNSFYAQPYLSVSLIPERDIDYADYSQRLYTKTRKTFTLDDRRAVVLTDCEAACFNTGAIEYGSGAVFELKSSDGRVNGEDYVVDLEKIINSFVFAN